jgi:hypothetical protein
MGVGWMEEDAAATGKGGHIITHAHTHAHAICPLCVAGAGRHWARPDGPSARALHPRGAGRPAREAEGAWLRPAGAPAPHPLPPSSCSGTMPHTCTRPGTCTAVRLRCQPAHVASPRPVPGAACRCALGGQRRCCRRWRSSWARAPCTATGRSHTRTRRWAPALGGGWGGVGSGGWAWEAHSGRRVGVERVWAGVGVGLGWRAGPGRD